MYKRLLVVLFISLPLIIVAQIPVDSWRVHLPYQDAKTIAVANDLVYCGTGVGLYTYHRSNGEITKLSKIEKYSDVGISSMAFSKEANVLIIGYENGNLDLVDSTGIPFNISDIKRKLISASKRINNIQIINDNAYLACGFGVVLVNLSRKEITETYLIGEGGAFVDVNQIALDGDTIYAATGSGIYYARLSQPNLIDFNNWTQIQDASIPSSNYSGIVAHKGKIMASIDSPNDDPDYLYYYDGVSWSNMDTTIHTIRSMNFSYSRILISRRYAVDIYNNKFEFAYRIYTYDDGAPRSNYAIFDENGAMWIADENRGLIKSSQAGEYITIAPNGPYRSSVVQMDIKNNILFAAGGSPNNPYANFGAYVYQNGFWENYNYNRFEEMSGTPNISTVIIDPTNPNHFYGGSWGYGLLEFNSGELVEIYDETNSILENIIPFDQGYIRVSGMDFDYQNALWMVTSQGPKPIYAKLPDGSWYNYEFENTVASSSLEGLINTMYDHKWTIVPKVGLFVWSVKGTYDDESDDDYKLFSIKDENGKVISADIASFAEDRDGSIWIGLNEGVVVYYSPQNVFSGQNFYAQRPIIEVDGDYQYLLNTETITAIAIDGANRKWFGTLNSGVYLMSGDGREQIMNFNENNSPLISNNITSIAINDQTGEVFFGTDKGIVSYKSTATQGNEFFNDVYVYPNPVREDYDGVITITGLVEDVDVKITDISGNLVYTTTANGGNAIWNGKNFMNQKVQTGVYLIFCTNDDGSKTFVTKLLFIN